MLLAAKPIAACGIEDPTAKLIMPVLDMLKVTVIRGKKRSGGGGGRKGTEEEEQRRRRRWKKRKRGGGGGASV